jgi:CspA family cold shock protein
MGKYRDHREPRRRRHDDLEPASEPSYFQRSPAANTEAHDAEVLWFNASKGFGFVKLCDGTEVYLHIRVLEAAGSVSVSEGRRLKVTIEESSRGRQVGQVIEISEEIARPASPMRYDGGAVGQSGAKLETEGTVKWYNSEKGFGFISPASGEQDIFVHVTALNRSGISALAEGQKVIVECGPGKKGLEIRSIRLA